MGRGGWRAREVDVEENDDQEPQLGEDVGLHRGLEEGSSDRHHRRVPQPRHSMESANSTATRGPLPHNGGRYVPPDRRQLDRPVGSASTVRRLFKELDTDEAKQVLMDVAQGFL